MPHQTKPGDIASYTYGHTIGDYPEVADALLQGNKIPSLEDIKKMRAKDYVLPVSSQNATLVPSDQTNNFINAQNKQNMGVSQTNVSMDFDKMGTLGTFMKPAMAIMDQVYQDIGEPTQREKDINMGRMFLKFFTKLGAGSSVPGQTAFGAANIAGAEVAQDYINSETKKESDKKKLAQAKKSGALTLATQLKSADEAKKLAELKAKNVKPSKPDQYKILNVAEVRKKITLPSLNPMTGEAYKEGDIIELTPSEFGLVPRGNLISYKEVSPPKPVIYERLRDGIIKNAQLFFNLKEGDSLPPGVLSKLIANITELRDTKLVPIPDPKDPNKTVMTLQQGVNMYEILEKEFGAEKVNKLKKLAGIETADKFITPGGSEEVGEGKDKGKKFETLNIGGTKFTILSTKDSKLGTTEVKSLTNAKSGLKDLNTALSLIFPNGKYNQKLVATMNIAPTWSLGLIGTLSGSDVANNARTTIQSMQRAIEIILRERSGAAVPPAELVNYLKLYLPNTFDNEVQARNKIDALLQYFKGSIDGINQGRQKGGPNEDTNFVSTKLPMQIKDNTAKSGGIIMGRRLQKQGSVMYIETEPGSNEFIPLVTKPNN